MKGVPELKPALDPQPPQGGEVLEGAAPRDLIKVPRVANAMLLRKFVEVRLGLVHDDTG
jgi:hypothetical protein